MTRVAIIGTGFWGTKLAEAVGRSSLELTACYSRNAENRGAFAERFCCEAAESYESALDAADAVILATPNGDHEAQTVAAAARGLKGAITRVGVAATARLRGSRDVLPVSIPHCPGPVRAAPP
jgi:predicted dinucleotide-binding enzyme